MVTHITTTEENKLSHHSDILNIHNINPSLIRAEYAIRGELSIRAEELKYMLQEEPEGQHRLPFSKIINCNIGNPQQLGQKPITFFRQVISLLDNQELLDKSKREEVEKLFPIDAIERAEELKSHVLTTGSYTHSQGVYVIRKHIAQFIERRDSISSDPSSIFLSDGATSGILQVINLLISDLSTGFLLPVPQYPVYSAFLTLFNGRIVPYYLDEEDGWGLSMDELDRAMKEAREHNINVRVMVVINPGNPTGQVLRQEHMINVIKFCRREKLVLLADEVYQDNIYVPETNPFISFKKLIKTMGLDYENIPLISFHSASKGMIGECGRRGGYFECTHVDPDVLLQIYKRASICLCPNIAGQVMVDLMVNPPKKYDESYNQYQKEIQEQYQSLKRRAFMLQEAFNSLEGVTCNAAQGSMYLFPRIRLPKKAIMAAQQENKHPDLFYALAMLNHTGVCVVPGSGFGQKPGTYHIRSTFLPLEEEFPQFISKVKNFHQTFMDLYRDDTDS
jgi:aspartate/methionine/tyrosine aminotransferase